MNPETFFDKFGLLADTPNGVQKLRELILQLAVQGRLVPQEPSDEGAEKILEQAKNEKILFVKEFRVRKPASSLPINDEEKPHELPHGWKWCRNSDLFALRKGKKPKNLSESEIGLPYLDIAALDRNVINRFTDDISCPKAKEGDLIIVCDGSRSGLVLTGKNGVLGSTLAVIHNFTIDKDYLRVLLLRFYNEMNSEKKGAAIPHLDIAKMYSQIIGLPPFKEQHRIVAKVDQLMVLCDELEALQQKKQETRLRLNSAALDKLLTAYEPAEFANHWQRVCDNFDLLYDNPETVGELRKAILQLAVQGKLVRQDEDDEPAAVLLEKIKAEKERLIKENKFIKTKPISAIEPKDIPYQLPLTWIWTKIGNLCISIVPNRDKPKSFSGGIPWITLANFCDEKIELKNVYSHIGLSENEVIKYNARIIPKGSVVMSCIGRFGLVTVLDEDIVVNQQLHGFVVPTCLYPRYLAYAIKAQKDFLEESATSTTISYLNKTKCESIPIPLPPFAEQRRIVAKVDQLMALCDDLEAKLDQSQTDGAKLMEAVVAELVGA